MMDLRVILFSLLFVCAVFGDAEDKPAEEEENFSVILGDDNFKETIATNNFFVKFYAPWCGHCVRLKPTWNELAELLNTQDESRVRIATVNCVENQKTCSENGVAGYPTLKFFKLGSEPVKYGMARDLPTLTSFINEQLDSTVAEKEEEQQPEVPEPQSGLVVLTDANFDELTATGGWFIKFYAPWCGYCKKLAPIWDDLGSALEHDETVNIGKVDCTVYRPICARFEVKGFPTLFWFQDGKNVDRYAGPRTMEDFKAYIEKRKGTPVEVEAKKEIIEEGEGGAVVMLSNENFNQVIEKDVTFVALTASWCGHCKRLVPTWQQLAEKFVGDDKIKIAKIDCSVGENRDVCSAQDVNGYPTIFLYKNGNKVSEYHGNRGLEDMYDFVKSHASDEAPRDEL